jgi:inner membrane protein
MIWLLSLAIFLMLLEAVLPGGVAFAFGVSLAILVLADYWGYSAGLIDLFLIWAGMSLVWIMGVATASRFIFKSIEEKKDLNDHSDWLNPVLVTETIGEGHSDGRIAFQGSTWTAISQKDDIPKGNYAQIIKKDNLTFIVVPFSENETPVI